MTFTLETEAQELTLNWDERKLPTKFPYLLQCINRLNSIKLKSDYRSICERTLGIIIGRVLINMRPLAFNLYNSAKGATESMFDQEASIHAIRLAATHGESGSIRYVCVKIFNDLKQADIFEASLLLSRLAAHFSNLFILRSLLKMSQSDSQACFLNAVFEKSFFPQRLDPSGQSYPFFKVKYHFINKVGYFSLDSVFGLSKLFHLACEALHSMVPGRHSLIVL